MTFSTQDKIWTLSILATDQNGQETLFTSSSPLQLLNLNISKINFHELTITEAHKVNGEWDHHSTEPHYDGYKATDSNGNVYFNQFPIATFGQFGFSSDTFLLDLLLSTDDVGDIDSYLLSLVKNNSTPYLYHLTKFLQEIDGGILKDSYTDVESQNPDIAEKFKLISQQVQDAFLAQTGLHLKKNVKKFLKWDRATWEVLVSLN